MKKITEKKNLRRSRSAVSEILGNILILGITVTLFTSVMAFVSAIPEPSEPVSATFDSALDEDILSITHTGGSTLNSSSLYIYITADDVTKLFVLSDGIMTPTDDTGLWKQGYTWSIVLTDYALYFNSVDDPYIPASLTIQIIYLGLTDPLYTKTISTDDDLPLEITNFKITDESDHDTNEIAEGDNFTIQVTILAPYSPVDTVYVNMSSLYSGTSTNLSLSYLGSNIYSRTSTSAPTSATGAYMVRITVVDEGGNVTNEFRQVKIVSSTSNSSSNSSGGGSGGGDEPSNPGTNNTAMIDDFYVLTEGDWAQFVASDGTISVDDTYDYPTGDDFVIAFKGSEVDLPSNPNWGTGTRTYSWTVQFYNAQGSIITNSRSVSGQTTTLNGTIWYYRTITLSAAESNALHLDGLYTESILRYRLPGGTYEEIVVGYFNLYWEGNDGIYVKTYGSSGQNKSIFEIGDTITFKVYTDDLSEYYWDESQSSSFYAASFYSPDVDKEIDVSWAGQYSDDYGISMPRATSNVFTFSVDTYEFVGNYLNTSSSFIYCDKLVIRSDPSTSVELRVAVKLYITQDTIVYEGSSIQAAINAASDGDSIRVFEDTFTETIYIHNNVTIWGNGTDSIVESSADIIVYIVSDYSDFRGFTITPTSYNGDDSVIEIDADWVTVSDIEIGTNYGRDSGILLSYSSNSVVTNNKIHVNEGIGIHSVYSDNCTISDNEISGSNYCLLRITHSNDATVTGNTISCSRSYPVIIEYSNNIDFNNNEITGSASTSLKVDNALNAHISNNTIDTASWVNLCVDIYQSNYLVFYNNELSGSCNIWISIDDSNLVQILSNSIIGPWWSTWLDDDGTNTILDGNTFNGNPVP